MKHIQKIAHRCGRSIGVWLATLIVGGLFPWGVGAQSSFGVVSFAEAVSRRQSDTLSVARTAYQKEWAENCRAQVTRSLLPKVELRGFWGYMPELVKPFSISDLLNNHAAGWSRFTPDLPSEVLSVFNRPLKMEVGQIWVGDLSVQQPLFLGGRIQTAYRMAQTTADLLPIESTLQERQELRSLGEHYAQAVVAIDKIRVLDRLIGKLSRVVAEMDSLHAAGVISTREQLPVRLEMNRVQRERQQAARGLKTLKEQLAHEMRIEGREWQLREETLNELSPSIFAPEAEEVLGADTLILTALRLKDDVEMMQSSMGWRAYLPEVGIVGHLYTTRPTFDKGVQQKFGFNWFVGLGVTVPLSSLWLGRGEYRKAQLEQEIRKIDHERARKDLERAQEYNRKRWKDARSAIGEMRKLCADAEKNRDWAEKGYAHGVVPLPDYMQALSLWTQLQMDLIDSYYEANLARLALIYPTTSK